MKKLNLLLIAIACMSMESNAQVQARSMTLREDSERGSIVEIRHMDQRKIYHWGNGQRATPSGRQADDPKAKFARVFGDSAVVVKRVELEKKK